jgi:hypothetical protein
MDPTLRKSMVVCSPFGEYVNGDQEGVMSRARLRKIADNFTKHPRQVPIYALGDHVSDLDERMPDGWVEGLSVNADGALVADVKIHGIAAAWVLDDQIRGASIGTVQGKNPDGSAQGEVLQHLLLTNNPFDKSLNIAASRKQGGEVAVAFFTALPSKEPNVADQKDQEIARLKDELAAAKAQTADEKTVAKLKEAETLLAEKIRECAELTAANANLREDIEKFKSNPALEAALADIESLKRRNQAAEVRRKVRDGVLSGQFSVGFLGGEAKSTYDHPSDEGVLAWFKAHDKFKGQVSNLDICLAVMDRKTIGRTYRTGAPAPSTEVTLTADDRQLIRKLGMDPEKVIAGMKSTTRGEFEELTAKEK